MKWYLYAVIMYPDTTLTRHKFTFRDDASAIRFAQEACKSGLVVPMDNGEAHTVIPPAMITNFYITTKEITDEEASDGPQDGAESLN